MRYLLVLTRRYRTDRSAPGPAPRTLCELCPLACDLKNSYGSYLHEVERWQMIGRYVIAPSSPEVIGSFVHLFLRGFNRAARTRSNILRSEERERELGFSQKVDGHNPALETANPDRDVSCVRRRGEAAVGHGSTGKLLPPAS